MKNVDTWKSLLAAIQLFLCFAAMPATAQFETPAGSGPAAATAPKSGIVATVDGTPIYQSEVDAFIGVLGDQAKQMSPADLQSRVVDRLIDIKLADEKAMADKFDQDPLVAQRLHMGQITTIADAYLEKNARARITDEMLKAKYDDLAKQVVPKPGQPLPSFEQVKPKLTNLVLQDEEREVVEGLRKDAKIVRFKPDALVLGGGVAAAQMIGHGEEFPALTGLVVDEAGVLSPQAVARLTVELAAHKKRTGQQVVVAVVKSLNGRSVEEYGYQLGRFWGIGQKGTNTGAILLVSPSDRKVRIEVGYGLEGDLTDAIAATIINVILPQFRKGDIAGGVVSGTEEILRALGDETSAGAFTPKSN